MANRRKDEPDKTKKKPQVTLRDLTVSKDAHVVGGASGKPDAKLRDLTASKESRIISDSGR